MLSIDTLWKSLLASPSAASKTPNNEKATDHIFRVREALVWKRLNYVV
jgi:hypothetical protein